MEVPVSVIIPAHNAGSFIRECLTAVFDQDPAPAEVIVVDDDSTDDTAKIAAEMGAMVFRVSRNKGPSHARNMGAEKATGQILFFVDADVVLIPGSVGRVADAFSSQDQLSAMFGSYTADQRTAGVVSQYRNLLHHYTHQCAQPEAFTFWSACGAIRREIFLNLGGFDENAFPRCIEDIELGYRIKTARGKILIDKKLQGIHLKQWTLWSIIKTDVLCRAIPWARLESERPGSRKDLNLRSSQKISVILLGLAIIALAGMLWNTFIGVLAAVSLLAVIALNFGLYWFFFKQEGVKFALIGMALHLLYFFYSGLSFLYVCICCWLRLPIRDGNRNDHQAA
jgi:glycosyltransferase involved in cell wall biosynthesis